MKARLDNREIEIPNMNKQQKPPERIYLQHDPENTGEPFSEAAEVTWCKDRIFDTDQEYIRADLVDSLRPPQ
jgi:hypothetical protein